MQPAMCASGLQDLGLESYVKTSGGKGLHVVSPLEPSVDWDELKAFAHGIAVAMERDEPSKYVSTMAKKARGGKIFVDYLRNGRGATAVAAYSTRARPGATISTPVSMGRAWTRSDANPVHGREHRPASGGSEIRPLGRLFQASAKHSRSDRRLKGKPCGSAPD